MKQRKLAKHNVVVKPRGSFIRKSYNFLAAIPDGLVDNVDSSKQNSSRLVEVILVFLEENDTLCQALVRKINFLLDPTDGHFTDGHLVKPQVQISLSTSTANACYRETGERVCGQGSARMSDRSIEEADGVSISVVKFNPEFWSSVPPKLEAFYKKKNILVELAYPRVRYGLSNFCMGGL